MPMPQCVTEHRSCRATLRDASAVGGETQTVLTPGVAASAGRGMRREAARAMGAVIARGNRRRETPDRGQLPLRTAKLSGRASNFMRFEMVAK